MRAGGIIPEPAAGEDSREPVRKGGIYDWLTIFWK